MDEREARIARQCAFKGAIETLRLLSTDLTDEDTVEALVERLTNSYEIIIHKTPLTSNRDRDFDDPEYDGDEEDTPQNNSRECPRHHKAKENSKGLYCPTKLADGSWCDWKFEEDARICNVCHKVLAHKTGAGKTGKPWGGWMCPDRDCKGTPVWD